MSKTVFLVEDVHNAPGRIYAVFADKSDAENYATFFNGDAVVVERTLFYGQPPRVGYCK